MQTAFVILQGVLLALFLMQDTVPLRPLNNQREMLKHLGWTKIILGTAITSGCVATSLYLTLRYNGVALPLMGKIFFACWWGMLMMGMYLAWYKPYFLGPTPKDLEEYAKYHGDTHTILPPRHGYPGPNTFHFAMLHPVMIACAVLGFLKVVEVF